MFSSRKEIEELEARIETILNSQIEMQEIVSPLQANIERSTNEGLALLTSDIATRIETRFESQHVWLVKAFKGVLDTLLDGMKSDKLEVLSAIRDLSAKNEVHINALQGQFLKRTDALETQNQRLLEQLEMFQSDWQESVALEVRDESGEDLEEWGAEIAERLREFDQAQGMPREFARQLFQALKKLRALHADWEGAKNGFASHIDELQRVLFAPAVGLSWDALTRHNSTSTQRKSLRSLETALFQFRGALQEKLRRETGIAPLDIVPMSSRFDARYHETNEFLEVPTGEASQHNLILSIERPGFQKTAPDGQITLLQIARVRRYVLDPQIAPSTPALQNMGETAPQRGEASTNALEVTAVTAAEEIAPALDAPGDDLTDETPRQRNLPDEVLPDERMANELLAHEPKSEQGTAESARITGQL